MTICTILHKVDLQKAESNLPWSQLLMMVAPTEYLRVLMGALVMQSHLLTGSTFRRVPLHNALAVQKRDFHMVGIITVLSLTQGGPAPTFFFSFSCVLLLNGCNYGTHLKIF